MDQIKRGNRKIIPRPEASYIRKPSCMGGDIKRDTWKRRQKKEGNNKEKKSQAEKE